MEVAGLDPLWSSSSTDYESQASSVRGAVVSFDRLFNQSNGPTSGPQTNMRAFSQTDWGMHKVRAYIDANAAAGYHNSFGSVAPSTAFAENYIGSFDWANYTALYDPASDSYVYANNSILYHYDNWDPGSWSAPNPGPSALVFDSAGAVRSPSWASSEQYYVPNMPEVSINLDSSRYASAYSRWEDMFYFGGGSGGGVAKFAVHLTGTLTGDGTGGFWYMARDWAGKDGATSPLASRYVSSTLPGTILDEFILVSVPFNYGEPAYVKSEASVYLWGEGDVDLSHTVTIESVDVPAGTSVYSYGQYLAGNTSLGFAVTGGGVDGNTVGGGAGGYFSGIGGGGGGGTPPVPEPGTWALLLAGLGLVGLRLRRSLRAPRG